MKLSIFKDKRTSHPEILTNVYRQLAERLQNVIEWKDRYFTVCKSPNNTHFRSHSSTQVCSEGIMDEFCDNCFKGNIRSITPCFDALSYLCELFWSQFEVSQFAFYYSYAFYSFQGSFDMYYIYSTFIQSVVINKDFSQPSSCNKAVKNKRNQT